MNTRTCCYLFDFLSCSLNCTSYFKHCWNNRTSAVQITYLSLTSPSFQTEKCHYNLTISVITILSAVIQNTSTISSLIIISQLNHFTFVSALLLPVLLLNLNATACIVFSLPKFAESLPLTRRNRLPRFRGSHLILYYTINLK